MGLPQPTAIHTHYRLRGPSWASLIGTSPSSSSSRARTPGPPRLRERWFISLYIFPRKGPRPFFLRPEKPRPPTRSSCSVPGNTAISSRTGLLPASGSHPPWMPGLIFFSPGPPPTSTDPFSLGPHSLSPVHSPVPVPVPSPRGPLPTLQSLSLFPWVPPPATPSPLPGLPFPLPRAHSRPFCPRLLSPGPRPLSLGPLAVLVPSLQTPPPLSPGPSLPSPRANGPGPAPPPTAQA